MLVARPKWLSKMNFQKSPVTDPATAHGSSTATPSNVAPRNARLSTIAVISATGSVATMTPIPNTIVRGMALRNSLSVSNRPKLFGKLNVMTFVFRSSHPEARHDEGGHNGRHHEEDDKDQARQKREERELPVTQAIDPAGDPAGQRANGRGERSYGG